MSVSSATSPTSGAYYSSLSSSAVANASTTAAAKSPTQQLGEADFLNLLSVQMQNQDPMKPMDDTAMIAQLAQFSTLQSQTQMTSAQNQLMAATYLGRNVTTTDANGKSVTGVVTAVDNSGASPAVVINNTSYALSTIKRIEPYTAPASAPAAAAAAAATPVSSSAGTGASSTGTSTPTS